MKCLVIILAILATVYSDKLRDTTYHLQPLNPLKVSALEVNVGDHLKSNETDLLLSGLENAEWKEIKWDLAKRRVDMKFNIPKFNFAGNYEVAGRILGLPIEGTGDFKASLDNMDSHHYFEYNVIRKNGKQFIDIKKTEMSYKTTGMHFMLNNLFNGNARLGRAMNEILNENWAAVNVEISPYFGNALGEVYSQVIQDFFKKVPLNDQFSD